MSAPGQTHGGVFTAMSSSHRSDGPALVALGLILAAIVLVSALGLASRYLTDNPQPNADGSGAQYSYGERGPSEGYWVPEFSSRDTYAQWAMTGLAFVATIISVVGVFLIRQTFIETKRTADAAVFGNQQSARAALSAHESADQARLANEIAVEIGRASARAYLNCTGATFSIANQLCVIRVSIKNFGQTPASHALLNGRLMLPNMQSTGSDDQMLYGEFKNTEVFDLPPSDDDVATLVFPLTFPAKLRQELWDGAWMTAAEFHLHWKDIFGESQTKSFILVQSTSGFVDISEGVRRREGEMRASNTRPKQTKG